MKLLFHNDKLFFRLKSADNGRLFLLRFLVFMRSVLRSYSHILAHIRMTFILQNGRITGQKVTKNTYSEPRKKHWKIKNHSACKIIFQQQILLWYLWWNDSTFTTRKFAQNILIIKNLTFEPNTRDWQTLLAYNHTKPNQNRKNKNKILRNHSPIMPSPHKQICSSRSIENITVISSRFIVIHWRSETVCKLILN